MNLPRDDESLENKMMRMSHAHNNLVLETKQNTSQLNRLINNLMYVLEHEIEDFEEKFKRADLTTSIESVIQSRLSAHLSGNLDAYKTFGDQLAVLRKQAKERGLQSLYNKVARQQRRKMEEANFGDQVPTVDPKKITHTPIIQVVENLNDTKRQPEAKELINSDDSSDGKPK